MTFWSVLVALAWDRLSPLHRPTQLDRLFGHFADWVLVRFNAGTPAHGWLAWAVTAVLPALLAAAVGALASGIGVLLAFAWAAAALYYCMGFRHTAEAALTLADALRGDDPGRVQERLAALAEQEPVAVPGRGSADAEESDTVEDTASPGADAPDAAPDPTRLAMEIVLRRSLDRLFGVVFWFVLLGPFGAVLYALSNALGRLWRGDSQFHAAVEQAVHLLDWLPTRLLAFSFAIVGNFDAAMQGWRDRPDGLPPSNEAVLLAAGFGALGAEADAPSPEYLSGAVSLVVRAALLWLAALGLLWLGGI